MPNRRKPTAIKKLQGNPGRRPLPEGEPTPTVGAPPRPHWLSGEAAEEWDRIVPILLGVRVLTEADLAPLALYCDAWGRFVELRQLVAESGWQVETHNGTLVQAPMVGSLHKAAEHVAKFCAVLGLTPVDRPKIQMIEGAKEKNALEKLLEKN